MDDDGTRRRRCVPKKHLSDGAGGVAWLGHGLEEVGRADIVERALGKKHVAGDRVEWPVPRQVVVDPAVKQMSPFRAKRLAINAQHVGP